MRRAAARPSMQHNPSGEHRGREGPRPTRPARQRARRPCLPLGAACSHAAARTLTTRQPLPPPGRACTEVCPAPIRAGTLTRRAFGQLHVPRRHRPLAQRWLDASAAQQDLALMLHNASYLHAGLARAGVRKPARRARPAGVAGGLGSPHHASGLQPALFPPPVAAPRHPPRCEGSCNECGCRRSRRGAIADPPPES